jgi:site-specific DNA recombinase
MGVRAFRAKAPITENLAKKPESTKDFGGSFRTALAFLANPWNFWVSDNPLHRKTLLKLVFAEPLPYVRNQGFRTAKTTSPFKALAAIEDGE